MIAAAVLAAACSHAPHKAAQPPPTSHAQPAPNTFAVVLDDTGMHVPEQRQPAGEYLVSFTDRRSRRRVKQRVAVAISPNGPEIALFTIPAGTRRTIVLLANESAQVMINGVVQWKRSWSLNLQTSKSYPTPAT